MTHPQTHETPLAGGVSESSEAGGFDANPTGMVGGTQVVRSLRLARARGDVSDTRMEAWEPTWREFVDALSTPTTASKGGAYYVRGACDGKRDDKHMAGARDLLLVIDGDTVADPDTGAEPDKVRHAGEDRPDYVLPCCDPVAVHEVLKAHGLAHVIHTSHSHGKRGDGWHKWRAVIPSNATPDNFAAAVGAVLDLLMDARLYVWPVPENTRLSQPWFFPRTAPDRAGMFMAMHHDGHPFNVAALEVRPRAPAAGAPRSGGHGDVIGQFNAVFLPGELLEARGYRRITERRYLSPHSTTGQPGVCILPDSGGRHFYVHNGSDPLADAKRHDAFDVLRLLDHDGDQTAALASARQALGLPAAGLPSPPQLWKPDALDRFTFDELTVEPDPTRYTVFPYLPAGIAGVLVGAGGTSKTGVMTLLCLHICTGAPLFGGSVEQGKVLFITAEDRRDVLRKHVWAHARELPPMLRQRVADNFIPADVVGLGFKLTRSINGQTVVAPDVDSLVEFARGIEGLRLVVFDTLSRLNGGEETNEDLARVVEAMEAVSRATGAATLVAHHTGKAQAREAIADQYSSRGASSLSDNARSVMLVQVVTAKDKDAPANATAEMFEAKEIIRLSHVKANDVTAPTRYLRRLKTAHRAELVPFTPVFAGADTTATVWGRVAGWMQQQVDVPHPTMRTLEGLGDEYGSRRQLRDAVHWALDRGLLVELPHPDPKGARKTYLTLSGQAASGAMGQAA